MLEKCKAFTPPTVDHEGWKDFMIKQLEDSISWDDSIDYHKEQIKKAQKLTADSYLQDLRKGIKSDIDYHTKHLNDDTERDDERSQWVSVALESIKEQKDL
jgi:hypothetical protein